MAKSHIRYLARLLADRYMHSEEIMTDCALRLKDVVLSPEEQKDFSFYKAEIDANLSLLSVALSAAAQGKISELIRKANDEKESFYGPLKQVVDDLANPDITEEAKSNSEKLVTFYNKRIRSILATISVLKEVQVFADISKSKKKQRRFFRQVLPIDSTVSLQEQIQLFIGQSKLFNELNLAEENFLSYVQQLIETGDDSDDYPVDDLSE